MTRACGACFLVRRQFDAVKSYKKKRTQEEQRFVDQLERKKKEREFEKSRKEEEPEEEEERTYTYVGFPTWSGRERTRNYGVLVNPDKALDCPFLFLLFTFCFHPIHRSLPSPSNPVSHFEAQETS